MIDGTNGMDSVTHLYNRLRQLGAAVARRDPIRSYRPADRYRPVLNRLLKKFVLNFFNVACEKCDFRGAPEIMHLPRMISPDHPWSDP